MPQLRTYNLFISHAWKYGDEYQHLIELLNNARNFVWKNYSVSQDDPLAGGSRKKLAREIYNQIRLTSVVLVIAGMYVAHREWLKYEIDLADKFNKPVIGIRPRGSVYVPALVRESAIEIVGWNSRSIVNAVRRNAL